jgi:hypothetical protein
MSRTTAFVLACSLSPLVITSAAAQTKTIEGERTTMTATVEAIEQSARTVTLRLPNDELHTVSVPERMKQFSELRVGDKITATYYETLTVRLKSPGEPDVNTLNEGVTPGAVGRRAGTKVSERTITATIDAIDMTVPSISFKGPSGWHYSTKVRDKRALEVVRVGDRVDITWTDAMLVSVARAASKMGSSAYAESPLEKGGGMVWASLGFQGDLGGSVNSSGVGTVAGQRAEIDANSWGERYDAALIFRIGGAYNVTGRSQVFGAVGWEQAEADTAVAGLIGGQPLSLKFKDYQGWGIDGGYRYFFNTEYVARPFVAASIGFQRVQEISVSFSSPTGFRADDVPMYDDSWVIQWRLGGGVQWDLNQRFGIQATVDLKYSGLLSDESGVGTLGFERINDTGNRWTFPIMGGVYVKF